MKRPILSTWIDHCLELEEENWELRALVSALTFALAARRNAFEEARGEIERRFPGERAA